MSVRVGGMLPQTNRGSSPDAILQVAEAAEELGFDALTVHDHIVFNGFWVASGMPGASGPGDDRDLYEALETLTFAAARTSRILLVASVIIVPIRHPVLLAKQIATLDALSGGRFVLGAGVGPPLRASEYEAIKLGPHRGNAAKEYNAVGVFQLAKIARRSIVIEDDFAIQVLEIVHANISRARRSPNNSFSTSS